MVEEGDYISISFRELIRMVCVYEYQIALIGILERMYLAGILLDILSLVCRLCLDDTGS